MRLTRPSLGSRSIRVLALLATALSLSLLASASAGGAEFGAPQILVHPDAQGVEFGGAIAIDRNTLAISGRTALGGDEVRSEVFIYQRLETSPTQWRLSQRLTSERGLDEPLALDGDTLVVGRVVFFRGYDGVWERGVLSRSLDRKVRGFDSLVVDGSRIAVGHSRRGTVLILEQEPPPINTWRLAATLKGKITSRLLRESSRLLDPDDPAPGFGYRLSLSGDRLVVGSTHGICCGKGGPSAGIFIFRRNGEAPGGWSQLHNFAVPGLRGTPEEPYGPDEIVEFGRFLSLSGPFLLAGEGLEDTSSPRSVTNRTRLHVYEQNHPGPDRWGRRRELRRARRTDDFFFPTGAVVRGNTAAVAEVDSFHTPSIRVFERDFPARNRWGIKADLSLEPGLFGSGTSVALGPRELVVNDQYEKAEVRVYPRAPIAADDFESGALAAWPDSRGAVEVVSPGLAGSDSALAVELGTAGPAFVASNRPRREPSVSLRFSLLANEVNLGRERVEILRLHAGRPALRLSLEESSVAPRYHAVLEIRRPNGGWRRLGRPRILPDREAVIEIEYSTATANGAKDGAVRFAVNGRLIRQAEDLDLDRMLIGRIVLGLPEGSPPTASGNFLIDGFEMHR